MSQNDNNKKKKRKIFGFIGRKNKNKSSSSNKSTKSNIDLDEMDNDHTTDHLNNDDIKTSKESNGNLDSMNHTHDGQELQSDHQQHQHQHLTEEATEGDEIGDLVNKMSKILYKLKETCHTKNNTHHAMDLERFQKLIDWVDYNESHLRLLQQAWTDPSFWPFLATEEATKRVKEEPELMLIRLSNTKPGAITVTRSAKVMKRNKLEDIVKHKRYFPSAEFGKLTLTGSWGEREVTWDGLLAHLKQKECCICLEELKDVKEVLRLNCGHHFHRHCIERHVQHSKRMNNSEFAICPLCRTPIKNAQLYQEPTLAKYDKMPGPDMLYKKSQSVNNLFHRNHHHNHHQQQNNQRHQPQTPNILKSRYKDGIQRAATANLTPTHKDNEDDDDEDDNAKHMFAIVAKHQNQHQNDNNLDNLDNLNDITLQSDVPENHQWHQFGNHLDVGSSIEDNYGDDEYGNAAAAANIAKYKQQQQ